MKPGFVFALATLIVFSTALFLFWAPFEMDLSDTQSLQQKMSQLPQETFPELSRFTPPEMLNHLAHNLRNNTRLEDLPTFQIPAVKLHLIHHMAGIAFLEGRNFTATRAPTNRTWGALKENNAHTLKELPFLHELRDTGMVPRIFGRDQHGNAVLSFVGAGLRKQALPGDASAQAVQIAHAFHQHKIFHNDLWCGQITMLHGRLHVLDFAWGSLGVPQEKENVHHDDLTGLLFCLRLHKEKKYPRRKEFRFSNLKGNESIISVSRPPGAGDSLVEMFQILDENWPLDYAVLNVTDAAELFTQGRIEIVANAPGAASTLVGSRPWRLGQAAVRVTVAARFPVKWVRELLFELNGTERLWFEDGGKVGSFKVLNATHACFLSLFDAPEEPACQKYAVKYAQSKTKHPESF